MNLQFWWTNKRGTVLRLFSLLASYSSLVGLMLALKPKEWPWWALLLSAMSLIFLALLVYLELRARRRQTIYAKEDSRGIQDYMRRWIGNSGRVAVWSRDLTWAIAPDLKELLLAKARSAELVLCVPQSTDLTSELATAGADVCVYGVGDYAPASRFTITDFMRQGAQLAVGHPQGDFHVIDEFDATTHPAFYLAQDMVNLVRAYQSAWQARG